MSNQLLRTRALLFTALLALAACGPKGEDYQVFIYDNGPDYPECGLFRIVKNGKIGYADEKTRKVVIEPQFDCAFPFEDGKAKVSNRCSVQKDGEHSIWISDDWFFIDLKGKATSPPAQTGE